ncbi:hypothetical protein BHM03_00052597, partial [Ensete ventricosum]
CPSSYDHHHCRRVCGVAACYLCPWAAAPPHVATWSAGPPMGVVPTGDRRCGWAPRCRSSLLRPLRCRRLNLRVAAPIGGLGHNRLPPSRWLGRGLTAPAGGLAMASHPCRRPGRGRPPSFLVAFAAKTQQERVE